MSDELTQRSVLPIPERARPGLTTYDAKDPETSFAAIKPLRPPSSMVGIGSVPDLATSAPGYSSMRPDDCAPRADLEAEWLLDGPVRQVS